MASPSPTHTTTPKPHPDVAHNATLLTAPGRAALAVVRIAGPAAEAFVLHRLGRVPDVGSFAYGTWKTSDDAPLDDPLVARTARHTFDVNLHGGPAVVRRFLDDAAAHGFTTTTPEADPLTLPTTRLGLELLLAQRHFDPHDADPTDLTLRRLLVPARVALVGAPNAGKSTLANALAARDASLVSETPGTTRDSVETHAALCAGRLPVVLLDTPGRRDATGPEAHAVTLSNDLIRDADIVVLVRDSARPLDVPLPRRPDLTVWNKADLARRAGLAVAAATGEGLDVLEDALAHALGVRLDLPPRPLVT